MGKASLQLSWPACLHLTNETPVLDCLIQATVGSLGSPSWPLSRKEPTNSLVQLLKQARCAVFTQMVLVVSAGEVKSFNPPYFTGGKLAYLAQKFVRPHRVLSACL